MRGHTLPATTIPCNERGLALLLAAFSVLFVSLLVIAFCQVSTTDLQILDNFLRSTKALYIADAGVEDVISQLRADPAWSGKILETDPESALGEGYYKVDDGDEDHPGNVINTPYGTSEQTRIVTFQATGKVGTFLRIVDVKAIITNAASSDRKVTIISWDEVE